MDKTMKLFISSFSVLAIILIFPVAAVAHGGHAFVRTVNADTDSKTFTFSCYMDPDVQYLRDFFIRPDNGPANDHLENEAESLDRPQGDHFTYTFKTDRFYHVGCIIVNQNNFSVLYRGDLHIDLRKQKWDPDITPISWNGKTSTLKCAYSGSNYEVSWEVLDAQKGTYTNLGSGQILQHTVSESGLYDYICHLTDKNNGQTYSVPLPVEYFDSGDPYFPDKFGVPHGITNVWVRDGNAGNATPGNDTPPGDIPPDNTSDGSSCYNSVKDIPAKCNGGTIGQDTFDGGRHVICSNGMDSLAIDGWDKPDSGAKQYFEMYKKSQAGSGIEVCLLDACIKDSGYVKSTNYPICTENPSCTPATEVCDGMDNNCNSQIDENNVCGQVCIQSTEVCDSKDNDCDGQIDENNVCSPVCYSSVQTIPVTCDGGTISQDTYSGGRRVTCSGGASSLTIVAWDKPDNGAKQYFEMYKESQAGAGIKICIMETCIFDNGYAKSPNYPLCTGSGSGSGSLVTPVWIAPSNGLTNVAPNYFHLELMEPSGTNMHASSNFEVWKNDLSERIWNFPNANGNFRYHVHTPDGVFENSLAGRDRLDYNSAYKTRVRYKDTQGSYTQWSEWRAFTTSSEPVINPSSPDWSASPGFKVEKFTTGFDVPVHIAFAPPLYNHIPENQRPFFYVTELYGKVKVVYKDGSQSVYAQNLLNFDPFGSITGGGQMGVVGLYVDDQTGDLFVGMTYVENDEVKNKVVRFYTSDDGRTYASSNIIISNLPSAPSHQVQQITKSNGKLYINLGDALKTSYPQNNSILAGKIIRMNMDGSNVEIYAKGFRNPFGADWRPGFNQLFVTDNAPDTGDRLLKVVQGGNYGWCCSFPAGIFGLGVSPVDVEFNPGNSGFPADMDGRMYVAVGGPIYQEGPVNNGKHILEFILDNNGNVASHREFVKYTGDGYGTPIGMDFGPDGLYFTDIYGEPGFVGLGETEANVYRVVPGQSSPCSNCEPGDFRAGISIIPWYPKDAGNGIEYIFECQGIDGSGNYLYDFDFGDGEKATKITWNRQYHKYPYGDRNYQVSCTVHDKSNGKTASASMTINPSNFIPEK